MNEDVPQCVTVAGQSNSNEPPQRRRSARLTASPQNVGVVDKMAAVAVKRSIVVRKIEPRKTAAVVMVASEKKEHNDEQDQRMSEGRSTPQTIGSVVDKMAPLAGAVSAVKRSIVVRKIEPRKTAAVVVVVAEEKEHTEEKQRLSEGSLLRKRPKPSIIPDPGPPTPRVTRATPSPRPPGEKRSIVVRKITPRKTAAVLASEEHDNKENEEQRLSEGRPLQKKPKISTPDPGPGHRAHSLKKTAMPSPILASPPRPSAPPQSPTPDRVWSQKVRRSYSRLSDQTINSPPSNRENLFGFDNMKTPEVIRKPNKTVVLDISKSLSGVNSFTSWLEGDDCSPSVPAPDLDIPGVVMVKEKRRRRKVQKIDLKAVDVLAAKMNAEFDEAEGFDLFVE